MTNPQRIAVEALSFRSAIIADIPALQTFYSQLVPDEEPAGDDMRDTLSNGSRSDPRLELICDFHNH